MTQATCSNICLTCLGMTSCGSEPCHDRSLCGKCGAKKLDGQILMGHRFLIQAKLDGSEIWESMILENIDGLLRIKTHLESES